MRRSSAAAALAVVFIVFGQAVRADLETAVEEEDPYLWLEEVEGEKALAWAKEQSARTARELQSVGEYRKVYDRALQIYDSQDRIPSPSIHGGFIYNFWQDKEHPRGIWRRTSLASYGTAGPAWETVIDVDAVVKAEGVNWVWEGASCLPPDSRRCMVSLSRGGSDAAVYREFDTRTRSFVEGGFSLPEAKSSVSWRDEDALWVGTDFGPGTLTESGYPRVVKLWKRGTPLSEARTVFEARESDVSAFAYSIHNPEGRYDLAGRSPAFFRSEMFLVLGGRLVKLDLPEDVDFHGFFMDRLLLELRSGWTAGGRTYPQGALISIQLDRFLTGDRDFEVLFEPSERVSLGSVTRTRDQVFLSVYDNVRGRVRTLSLEGGAWKRGTVEVPGLGSVGVSAASPWESFFFYTYSDFLTPQSLYLVEGGTAAKVKSMPAFFEAEGMTVEQHEAVSRDGTRVPYFAVLPKGFKADGRAPALLYGYGGFEIPQLPRYSPVVGAAWLERGGAYLLANIRGGGEFGPRWHQAAQRKNRIKAYEDFIAVAEDAVARKLTSPKHLGIMGGSQGGLLVGGAMTLRPDLFGAVVAQIPLADMRRYHKMLAGASWMEEYGDPDAPEEWASMRTWSPYQNLRKDAVYPRAYFWTTTRDDRVHPGHARKMAAKMLGLGHPVYYYENIEGGHGSGSVNAQKANTTALEYAYLWKMLR